ncbi:c-type cytochrome [Marinobacterium sediminicola]|uniref:Cytochrome c5 n=1 Tax=Marinobacterium sediminicola TaxID=518898 RepID=A0ABY1S359_9GAMM|nr:c-type cytochrome [Marinobacterium sediminicola]ULG69286.1 c-type cytochrome [Marinobacterium sediminicola]SMR77635.1 Cytochrome c5 [Marinobacterium sediminicola]
MKKFAAKAASALCAFGLSMAMTASVQAAADNEAIIERIKPVGSVCVQGDENCGGAASAAAASTSGARSGEEIYTGKCAACHASGVLGAPKFGTNEMQLRLDEKGMETLLSHAINGFNAMPPRGTCSDCSDEEIEAAVNHMLGQ